MSPKGDTSNNPALEYVRMVMRRLKERDYNPRPPRTDAQSGQDMIDMNEKTPRKQNKKWTKMEDRKLLAMAEKRVKRSERAKVLKRSVMACDQRLFNLRQASGTNPLKTNGVKRTAAINKVIPASDDEMVKMLKSMEEIFKQNTRQRAVIQATIDKMENILVNLKRSLE
tara:strand:+ start:1876 stop:2382 length:507 start_codon:yes stop_codon:yes gene_type:complete